MSVTKALKKSKKKETTKPATAIQGALAAAKGNSKNLKSLKIKMKFGAKE